jgi:hypothetical protein
MVTTEKELDTEAERIAGELGIWTMAIPDSRRMPRRGWPDRVFVGPRGALFRELKSQTGELTHDQRLLGYRMVACGLNWAVWRPSDLAGGKVRRELKAIAWE